MFEVLSERPYTLKQILEEHWEGFETRCAHENIPLRPSILENVRKVRNCRNPDALGYHTYQCPTGCSDPVIVPHSCKSRFCSSCGKVATDRWMEKSMADLLDVPYHHVVFTIPQELRNLFAWQRPLLGVLFSSAKDTLLSICREKYGYVPGIVMVQHTFGSALNFNAHIHVLLTQGGLSVTRTRWVHNTFIPWDMLKARWKYHVVSRLKPALRAAIAEERVGQEYTRLGTGALFFKILGQPLCENMVRVDGRNTH